MAAEAKERQADGSYDARRAKAIALIDDKAASIILEASRAGRHPVRSQAMIDLPMKSGLGAVWRREDLRPRNGNDRLFYSSDIDDDILARLKFWERVAGRFRAVSKPVGPWPAADAANRKRRALCGTATPATA